MPARPITVGTLLLAALVAASGCQTGTLGSADALPDTASAPSAAPARTATPKPTSAPAMITISDEDAAPAAPGGPVLQTGHEQPHCPPHLAVPGGVACPPGVAPPHPGPIPQHFHPITEADLRTGVTPELPWVADNQIWHDEYICDGGDRAHPIHYTGTERLGLDTEDAIAEFMDHTGERHVKPTNKVCIYAPRFGSVSTTVSPQADTSLIIARREAATQFGQNLESRVVSVTRRETDQPINARMRTRASGLEADASSTPIAGVIAAAKPKQVWGVGETFTFLQTGRFERTESAWIRDGLQAAVAWTREANPVIVAKTLGAQRVDVIAKATEVKVVEDLSKPGDLRIVKLADKQIASPGDVVEFSIRYDNLGDKPLYHVQVLDNLTPRLEYIADSATMPTGVTLETEENGEGSLVLKFVLSEPLLGKTGGVLRFKTRVR